MSIQLFNVFSVIHSFQPFYILALLWFSNYLCTLMMLAKTLKIDILKQMNNSSYNTILGFSIWLISIFIIANYIHSFIYVQFLLLGVRDIALLLGLTYTSYIPLTLLINSYGPQFSVASRILSRAAEFVLFCRLIQINWDNSWR